MFKTKEKDTGGKGKAATVKSQKDAVLPDEETSHSARIVKPTFKNEKHHHKSVDARLVKGFSLLLEYLGRDNDLTKAEVHNYADTAVRAAKAFKDLTSTKSEINAEVRATLETGFPTDGVIADELDVNRHNHLGIVSQGPIKMFSLCPHHLLSVEYDCYVAYVPQHGGAVLGLSKLARLAKVLGKRPILQEQLASDIADVLCIGEAQNDWINGIETVGSAVMLIGRHMCMSCRGVQSMALTATSQLRGVFWDKDMELKFQNLVRELRESSLRA